VVTWSVVSSPQGSSLSAVLALSAAVLPVAAPVPVPAAPPGAPEDVLGPPEQPARSVPAATVSTVRRKAVLMSAARL
jgi:hypothetical protein